MVKSLSDVKRLISCCKSTGYASVDWETNAKPLYVAEFKPTILSVSWRPGYGASIICDHFEAEQYVEKGYNWLEAITMFGRAVLENPKITKLAWNWKFDNQIFYKYGIYYQGTVIDGMLAKYLLDEEQPNGLKDMVRRFIPEFADYEKYDNFDSVAWDKKKLEPLCQYGCMDTDATLRLSLFFEKKLIDNGFYKLYRNLLMAASRVLQTTEQHGLLFDKQLNSELKIKYDTIISNSESKLRSNRKLLRYEKHALDERKTAYIEKLEEEIAKLENDKSKNSQRSIQNRREKISRVLAGVFKTNDERKLVEPFNFKSVKQLADLLYINKYGFKFPVIEYTVDSKTKKPSENPSTSEAVLLKLKDMDKTDFIQNLLDIRAVQTINSTFIYGLGDLVQDDGCVHPRFLLHGTTSGRLCIASDSAILTNIGLLKIGKLIPKNEGVKDISDLGLMTLTHLGNWKLISHAINKGYDDMYEVTLENGKSIRCTMGHKFVTNNGIKSLKDINYETDEILCEEIQSES